MSNKEIQSYWANKDKKMIKKLTRELEKRRPPEAKVIYLKDYKRGSFPS